MGFLLSSRLRLTSLHTSHVDQPRRWLIFIGSGVDLRTLDLEKIVVVVNFSSLVTSPPARTAKRLWSDSSCIQHIIAVGSNSSYGISIRRIVSCSFVPNICRGFMVFVVTVLAIFWQMTTSRVRQLLHLSSYFEDLRGLVQRSVDLQQIQVSIFVLLLFN